MELAKDRPVARRGALWVLGGGVLLADALFYGQTPGVSVPLFALAVAGGVWFLENRPVRHGDGLPIVLLGLALLPGVVDFNALSLAFALLGLASFILYLHGDWRLSRLIQYLGQIPVRALRDLPRAGPWFQHNQQNAREIWRAWAFPAVVGLGFVLLLLLSNPLLQTWLAKGLSLDVSLVHLAMRLTFWLVVAILLWGIVRVPEPGKDRRFDFGRLDRAPGMNGPSVKNALILFNLIFLVQTLTDVVFLWGHGALPQGVNPAAYAHRGAYPLMLTALLAGGFALAARSFTDKSPALRLLLILFVGQNVLLVFSALYRLQHYVEAFGLTGLRLAAAIWMGMVALGLLLTLWQIVRRHGNHWLMLRCAALGAGTLYLCCFLNFSAIIAETNLARADGAGLDLEYLCSLGPDAQAVVGRYEQKMGQVLCPDMNRNEPSDWRAWSLRGWWLRPRG